MNICETRFDMQTRFYNNAKDGIDKEETIGH